MRRTSSGSYFLVRPNPKVEREMGLRFERYDNELRWGVRALPQEINQLQNKHKDQTCHIVGKGPSLDYLDQSDFVPGPVIALNEAIHVIEALNLENKIYCLTQDCHLQNKCTPFNATMLLNMECKDWYDGYDNKLHFNPEVFSVKNLPVPLSAVMAVKVAELMGCNEIQLHAFDGCINNNLSYAKSLGYESTSGGDPGRFKRHKKSIDNASKVVKRWMPPKSKPISSSKATKVSETISTSDRISLS